MGMIEELLCHVAAAGGGTVGVDLFANVLPETTGICAGLFESAGIPPNEEFGRTIAWENPRVQVLARSTSPVGAPGIAVPTAVRARIETIYRSLHGIKNQLVGSSSVGQSYYLRVKAAQSPFFMQRDVSGRAVYSCNFDVQRAST